MTTSGASSATKPNRPKIKHASDRFATSGQGDVGLDQMIINHIHSATDFRYHLGSEISYSGLGLFPDSLHIPGDCGWPRRRNCGVFVSLCNGGP